jgi:hypothetical protein
MDRECRSRHAAIKRARSKGRKPRAREPRRKRAAVPNPEMQPDDSVAHALRAAPPNTTQLLLENVSPTFQPWFNFPALKRYLVIEIRCIDRTARWAGRGLTKLAGARIDALTMAGRGQGGRRAALTL